MIYSDNKALVNLLSRPSSKVPLRIECIILQLRGYDFGKEYIKSAQNICNHISHQPDQEQKLIESTIVDKYVNFATSTAVPIAFTLKDIATATKQDWFLQILNQTITKQRMEVYRQEKYDVETLKLIKKYQKFKNIKTIDSKHSV